MIVRYWQPFQEIDSIRQQLDSLFEDFTSPESDWGPAVDLSETEDEFVLQVVLPGLSADDIDIEASRKGITVSGEQTSEDYGEQARVLRRERRYGSFRRTVSLPAAIDHEHVSADYANGILTLRAPKAADVRNQVVKVNVAGSLPEGDTADAQ